MSNVVPRNGTSGMSIASATTSRQTNGAAQRSDCVIATPWARRMQIRHAILRAVRRLKRPARYPSTDILWPRLPRDKTPACGDTLTGSRSFRALECRDGCAVGTVAEIVLQQCYRVVLPGAGFAHPSRWHGPARASPPQTLAAGMCSDGPASLVDASAE